MHISKYIYSYVLNISKGKAWGTGICEGLKDIQIESWPGMKRGALCTRNHIHDTRGWNTKTTDEELTSAETMGKAGAGFCRRRLSDHPGSGTLPGTWKVDTWIESLSLEHRLPHNPVFTIIKKSSKNLTASRGLSHSSMTPKNWWKKYRLVEWILVSELKGSHSEERWLISNSRRKESKGTKQRRNLKNV